MITTQLKSISVCFLFLFLSACGQSNPSKKIKPTAKEMNLTNRLFTGKFIASYKNAEISAELIENNTVVNGFFYMDGVKNELIAISNRNTMNGKIKDTSKNIGYDFSAILKDKVLHFSITFPELHNQVVELLLTKQEYSSSEEIDLTISNRNSNITTIENAPISNSKPNASINSRTKDRRLIGTWRYTEVLSSSGYAGNYASAATEYFIQFKPNGECRSWTGASVGGTSDFSFENSGNSNAAVGGWYTKDKNVIFYDLSTNEEASIPFLADENRFLLKGAITKIYERVNSK
jgi:DNA-binding cell septation regulator SpoVG